MIKENIQETLSFSLNWPKEKCNEKVNKNSTWNSFKGFNLNKKNSKDITWRYFDHPLKVLSMTRSCLEDVVYSLTLNPSVKQCMVREGQPKSFNWYDKQKLILFTKEFLCSSTKHKAKIQKLSRLHSRSRKKKFSFFFF